ncbi:2-hydroxy-6-oxo-6-phenylhexa-2,4-dienoate hydrolase [Legionella geestiana]|uniref:2-hydroxy-6-oxo-6-phenylhexa-2,4-dienoate hydrolase n=1 Tax=Legionella geestiana TaxID=45065 RepID=A0A0W0TQW2_9GAMM|nr:alpha/beta fold hydrolase [Legionella geestiana]KTC97910.1 2-hydroxy-6-oxo-6-phenylhexa-2,4-dienoate hydrolase [Legionella geestiana]QBS11767.1 alpha/beta fold hydrolase [Legionella geestiana]QDQ40620.1 alpha/beta fold hydrolase [Legionella geestiana]STX53541.1 Bem46 protein [Legionella geestiana]
MKEILQFAVLMVIVLMLLVYVFQRQLIYFPSREMPRREDYQAEDMRVVTLHTRDGLRLQSWFKAPKAGLPVILYLHGNAGHIGYRMPFARQLLEAGFGLLQLEYRGYGGNEGHPTEAGLYEDARAGMRFLESEHLSDSGIVVFGESLGTAVATQIALENQFCAVILQSPFTSLSHLARYHYPWALIPPWDRYDSLERIGRMHAPLLIVHGLQDAIVPYAHGKTLYQAANAPKKMLSFTQAGHNTLWSAPEFSRHVIDFIKSHCAERQGNGMSVNVKNG